ncbi:MAG: peptide ABC transporter substrate-binding protein [Kofleriaceae bacterium]
MLRACVLIVVAGCSLPDGDYFGRVDQIEPGHLRWCNQGEPGRLDPALASSTTATPLVHALFDALTTYGPDGLPVASLATSWEIADDLRTLTFRLRSDARWSDGTPIDAYDVAYTAFRVLHPQTGSPNGDNLQAIKNATAYLTRRVFVMRASIGPFHMGDVVELAQDPPAAMPDVAMRTSSTPLALRDLGAPEATAYARVPAGTRVTLVMTSGGRATPPSVDGQPWAYVFWNRDAQGVFGWVPARELDGEPNGEARFDVRRVTAKRVPGLAGVYDELALDDDRPRESHSVRGRDLAYSTDAIGITIPDPHTIVFECADPTPYFFAMTANRALRTSPIRVVSRWPLEWTRPEHIVTSGPLHLELWNDRDRVELVRSMTFWNPDEVKLERLTAFSMDDQAASTNTYFTGGCDATASNTIPSSYLPALNGEQRGRAYKDYDVSPYLGVYFAWVNTQRLSNRHLRRALALAIDRTQIPRFTHGGEMATTQLTPGTPIAKLSDADLAACGVTRETPGFALVMISGELCYVPPPGLDYDLEAAKRELALAKAELGTAWREPLEYRYNEGSEAHRQIGEYVQAAWSKIGLRVELASQEFNSLLDDTRNGRYDIARLGNIGNVADTESEFLPLFSCASPDNRAKYCEPAFEKLMAEARTLRDRKARNAKLREAERVMIEDAPVIPFYVYTQKHLVKPYVRDYSINLIDQPPLWRAWIDPQWRERAR